MQSCCMTDITINHQNILAYLMDLFNDPQKSRIGNILPKFRYLNASINTVGTFEITIVLINFKFKNEF